MAKFFSRWFRSGSSSFRTSQTSLSDNSNPNRASSVARSAPSLENLASYHVIPKELDKNKLHKAAWEGNLKKVQHLARPGQLNVKDQHMRTPLHLAVVKGHLAIVQYLVNEDAKLDVVDNEQRTPLIKAVLSGNQNIKINYEICKVLLNGGADKCINAVDKHGRNALHYAIDFDNQRLVQLFLSSRTCDPNYKDYDQMTPLHLAIKRKSPEIVDLLLSDQNEQQADPNIVNRFGQTPLHLAASVGYIDIIRSLLAVKPNELCDPTLLDSHQLTAYDLAKNNHHEACAKLIEEYEETWSKHSPRRLASTPFHALSSLRAPDSISLHPATNLERENDETSDDSSLTSTSKPSKSLPRRAQRPSDQWSDDNGLSIDESKPGSHVLAGLFKNNPLQSDTTKTNASNKENSVLNNFVTNNPLRTDTKKQAPKAQQTHSSSIFGIEPAFDRKDSDNTSTSISDRKPSKPVQTTVEKKPVASNVYVNIARQPVSNTKSWSDDTITAPVSNIKKKADSHNDTWDTSTSEDDKNIFKSKPAPDLLQKTLPFSPSKDDVTDSDSDQDSVETEIERSDRYKSSNQTAIQKLVNTKIGNGYKVIGTSDAQSPLSEESSWTNTSARLNREPTTVTKGIASIGMLPKKDESTWDDSQSITNNFKESKHSHDSSKLQSAGIENLVKIIEGIQQTKKNQPPTSSSIAGRVVTTSMMERTESIASENTLHEVDNDDDYEQSWKKKIDEKATKEQQPKVLPYSSLPHSITNLHGSISSTKSSFNDARFNDLKETIEKLERNQEDTKELKRQLKEMENKKNDFEKLYRENDEMLRRVENKLEQEKTEKQRLESTTKNLNIELLTIKQKLQSLQDEKDLLNQRCNKLKEERDNHDEKLHMLQLNSSQTTIATKNSYHEDDIDRIKSRHREELRLLSDENDDLHHRTKQLESDLQLHKESLDVTIRYKIDLEKALEEKTFYQRELDRLKHEKAHIEQEKIEYKTKYDSLQEEIRNILFDRSKLEQKLTSELHEHIQEKQRSTDDKQKYRTEIEQLNTKLDDAAARLHALQTQNESLLTSKDREIKNEFESLSQRLTQIESNKIDAEQRYHNQHNEITNKQQQKQVLIQSPIPHPPTLSDAHIHSSSCKNCNAFQRSYEQEREYRLQTEQANGRLRDDASNQYQYLNKPFLMQPNNEIYLVENSRKIRSDTERVKSELDRLRQDFDKLVSTYEPPLNFHHQLQLHSQVDTFRQFYEHEFRQRQLLMAKTTPGLKSTMSQNYHKPSSHLSHKHSFSDACSTCTNSRLLRERLESAIDLSLTDRRFQNGIQVPAVLRQASSLLTINTIHNGPTSSREFLRERYYV
ncbi:unnamed protein product [Rotaria socialis]|uniref:Uncharacterized protein n=2 Tax=Rotaria socialis TaxID=392032 RepID=A0A820K2Z0_9BILA|nr:unnamed protein product [Rotaria socialis]CAF4334990.1 unnamed protein product [Rotaria socialis]